ncbi:MAG: heat-inducible transcriptional repressor HrcA [Clostridiales bacterium]|nr:heat-inducible transcriptional repressor HrcA [Clostridiales bacterium]
MDNRKLRILRAIIDEYILSAVPVGSKSLSRNTDFALSSATIRNEMAGLEGLGYLEQPHTSAGRVPSDKAYRLYVDSMLQRAKLTERELAVLQRYCGVRVSSVEEVMRETARSLSEITNYTAIVLMPEMSESRLRHLQLVPLAQGSALAVAVTDAGVAREAVIRIPPDMSVEELEQISRMITQRYYNRTISTVAERLVVEIGEILRERKSFLQSLTGTIDRSAASGTHLVELSGATNILHYPEYRDVQKAKSFLAAVENKDTLYDLLKQASGMEFTITIGSENKAETLRDCSVVTASYKLGDLALGTFGIIGPTRMQYGKVLTILEYMRASLGEVLTGLQDKE